MSIVTPLKTSVNANGKIVIQDASLTDPLTVKYYGSEWNPTQSSSYTESKNEVMVFAVAKTTPTVGDSFYTIAVKKTNQYGIGKLNETTDVSWDFLRVDTSGDIDQSKSVWYTKGVSNFEAKLGVDLNGDGLKAPVKTVYNDSEPGLKLVKDTDKSIYIRDGDNDILVQRSGLQGPDILEYSSKDYFGSKFESTAVAAEAVTVDGIKQFYAVAVKSFYKAAGSNEEQNIRWTVYKVDLAGNSLESKSTKGIGLSYESLFKQDLNGDGVIGQGARKLDAADTSGVGLARDTDGVLYLVENRNDVEYSDALKADVVKASATSAIQINDSNGNPYFDENLSSTYGAKVVGVQKQTDGSYLVASRNTQISGDERTVTWNVMSLTKNNDNIFTHDWNNSAYNIKGISLYEEKFNQDLNGKDGIGFKADAISVVDTDKGGPAYLAKDSDGALYVKDESKKLYITDGAGREQNLENSYSMAGTSSYSYKAEAIAVERFPIVKTTITYAGTGSGTGYSSTYSTPMTSVTTTTTVAGYKLAIKQTSVSNGKTDINWQIHTLDENGRLDWSLSSSSKSVVAVEEDFHQDLNGDGVVGLEVAKLTLISKSPETNVELKRSADGGLYIIAGGAPIAIKDKNGAAISLENSGTYSSGYSGGSGSSSNESKAIAAEKVVVEGVTTYKLAIKMSNTYNGKTDVNWQIYTLNDQGVIDWSKPGSSTWTKSITAYEKLFHQDLNKDSYVGIDPASMKAVASDTLGATLLKDSDGSLYIKDGTNSIAIADANGGTPNLENSNSWSNGSYSGSYKSEAVAVEKTTDGYKLALKNTNVNDGKTDVSWQVYSLTDKGVLDWSRPGTSSWTKSITKFESDFKQDLNGDGAIGVDPTTLVAIATDTTGAGVLRGQNSDAYIKDGSTVLAISDTYGGSPNLEQSSSWTYDGKTNSNKSELFAAEKQSDGTYKLAIKYTNKNGDSIDVNWQVHSLSATGALDWSKSTWSRSITNSERFFNQDMNGDGIIGILPGKMTMVKTDVVGTQLAKDADKNIYIKDGQTYIALTDSYGGTPNLEYSNSWTDGSNESLVYAVEKQTDGTFKLAVKNTNIYSGVTTVNWQVYSLNAQGALDWSKSTWTQSISNVETQFKQDLNLDGFVGVDSSTMLAVGKDVLGATLVKDADGALFIRNGNDLTAITDSYGGAPKLEYSNSWTGGSNKSEAMAVQKQSDGTYRLAIKTTNVYNDKTDISWQIQTLSEAGVLDWSKSSWSKAITSHEKLFEQDLNGDGKVGIDNDKLDLVGTDTNGVRLARDAERALYVQIGSAWYAITDTNGGSPTLESSNSWTTGSYKSEAIAAQEQAGGAIKLVIKNTNTYDGKTTESWQVQTLSNKGVLDWSKSSWSKNVSSVESLVNEDLNGDKTIGLDKSKLTLISTDTTGHVLAKDADGILYIKVDANTLKTITDTYGSTSNLEFNSSWTGGSSKTEAYAVELQSNGTYKLALKNTVVNNGVTEYSWQIHTLSADGAIDWSKSSWTRSVASVEALFNQDLDGDSKTGIDTDKLVVVSTDVSGTGGALYKDGGGALYIKEAQSYIAIVDKNGGAPFLESSTSWTGGSASRVAYAVEKQADDTYRLAVKNSYTDTVANKTEVSWEIFTLSAKSSGTTTLDWGKTSYVKNIASSEAAFNQDLNGDATLTSASTTAVELTSDVTGIKLARGSDGALYIKADKTLMVQDELGNAVMLEDSQSASNYSLIATVSAVESVVAGGKTSYRLAVKAVTTVGSLETSDWRIYTLTDKGVVDPFFTSFKGVAAQESIFNQDMNGDGVLGIAASSLKDIQTDSVGDKLAMDPNGAIYINSSGQNPLRISDGDGGDLSFNFTYLIEGGSMKGESFAVEKQTDSSYKLAVKYTDVLGTEETISWKIHTLDATGKLDWTKADSIVDVTTVERDFNQDLNGDSIIGLTGLSASQNQTAVLMG